MNNEETKKKMVKVLQELRASKPIVPNDYGLQIISCTTDREIADALIATGIGDVKEAEHRAEVAERALSSLVHEMYEHCIRPMCDEKFFIESRLKEAEKELAEERK